LITGALPVPVAEAVPLLAGLCRSQVSVVPVSASVASTDTANGVGTPSSDISTLMLSPCVITGALLVEETVIVQDCTAGAAPSSPPSATCTLTSALVTPSAGVHWITPVDDTVMPVGALSNENCSAEPSLASSTSATCRAY